MNKYLLKYIPEESLFIDRLRVIAILLVVIGHATRMFTTKGVYHGFLPDMSLFNQITDFLYSFHMPLFIMISGYVYGICVAKGKIYDSFFPFVKKKALRLMIPYYFWGIIYVAPIMVLLGITQLTYLDYIKSNILLSLDCRHLWFLYSLFGIFIIVQGIRLIVKNKFHSIESVFLIISIIVTSVFNHFTFISLTPYFQVSNICTYLPFFLIGYAAFKFQFVRWGGVFTYDLFCIPSVKSKNGRVIGDVSFLSMYNNPFKPYSWL